jgi:hypothetical protein
MESSLQQLAMGLHVKIVPEQTHWKQLSHPSRLQPLPPRQPFSSSEGASREGVPDASATSAGAAPEEHPRSAKAKATASFDCID